MTWKRIKEMRACQSYGWQVWGEREDGRCFVANAFTQELAIKKLDFFLDAPSLPGLSSVEYNAHPEYEYFLETFKLTFPVDCLRCGTTKNVGFLLCLICRSEMNGGGIISAFRKEAASSEAEKERMNAAAG